MQKLERRKRRRNQRQRGIKDKEGNKTTVIKRKEK
jgi:hypothetical protein